MAWGAPRGEIEGGVEAEPTAGAGGAADIQLSTHEFDQLA
jgi:hypothetical protein